MATTNRKIYFYQVTWITQDKRKIMKNNSFFDGIINSFYQFDINDSLAFILNKSLFGDSIRGRISKIRKTDLPLKYNMIQKIESPLPLTNDEGLSEPTHFIVFGGKIIGCEFNGNGPRISILETMLNKKLKEINNPEVKKIEIKPILKKDIYKIMDKVVELRKIRINIATNYAVLLKDNDKSFEELFSAAELLDDAFLEISFSFGRKRGVPDALFNILNIIKKIFRRDDYLGKVQILKLRGRLKYSGPLEEIDLIEQFFMSEKVVQKLDDKARCVNSESMYTAIQESYNSFKEDMSEYIKED